MSGARARAVFGALAALLPVAVLGPTQVAQVPEPFPHEAHAGLFPLCTGCHVGVLDGAPAEAFPPATLCARCHDGVELDTVTWVAPAARVHNLTFDHVEHAGTLAREGDPDPGCAGCHGAPDERMRVAGLPDPEARCLTCHGDPGDAHLDDTPCATCHVPLAASGFARERIAALPRPADHDAPAFLVELHGRAAEAGAARCATCHVQERCTTCHVVVTEGAITAVPPAPAAMALPSFTSGYPRPATHAAADWIEAHAERASLADCGSCHTRNDCTVCHQGATPAPVQALPERGTVRAPGAGSELRAPESHASRFFARDHGGAASARPNACATCHTSGFCADCHRQAAAPAPTRDPIPERLLVLLRQPMGVLAQESPPRIRVARVVAPAVPAAAAVSRPSFHPGDFALRHAASAYGQTLECANCHSVEAFCAACHGEVGLAPAARPGPGFHDGVSNWLLGHGQPARQGLESCASCHRQNDCVQCHSTVGSFRVNPHGPAFDAARGWSRAPGTCLVCHLQKPL